MIQRVSPRASVNHGPQRAVPQTFVPGWLAWRFEDDLPLIPVRVDLPTRCGVCGAVTTGGRAACSRLHAALMFNPRRRRAA